MRWAADDQALRLLLRVRARDRDRLRTGRRAGRQFYRSCRRFKGSGLRWRDMQRLPQASLAKRRPAPLSRWLCARSSSPPSTLLALSLPAFAAERAAGPTSLGVFADWTAAEYSAGHAHVCYAFTRAIGSAKTPTAAMIIVSERATSRDEVVVNATGPLSGRRPKSPSRSTISRRCPSTPLAAGPFPVTAGQRVIAMQKGNGGDAQAGRSRVTGSTRRSSRSPASTPPTAPS